MVITKNNYNNNNDSNIMVICPMSFLNLDNRMVILIIRIFLRSPNSTLFWMAVVHLTLTSLILFAVGAITWLDCYHDPDWQELYTGHRPAEMPMSSRPTTSSSVTISMTTFTSDPHSSSVGHRLTPGPSLLVKSC